MHLSAQEQEELVNRAEVHRIDCGERRWSETTISTVQKDGRFYRILWERGLTENQDDEFEASEVPEVFESIEIKAKAQRHYLTPEEFDNESTTLTQRLAKEAESYEIVLGKPLADSITDELIERAEALLDVLPDLEALDIISEAQNYREITSQYLQAIIALGIQEGQTR